MIKTNQKGNYPTSIGITLAEMLIAFTLLSLIALQFGIFTHKTNASLTALSYRARAIVEIQHVFNDLRSKINNGARIDSQSTSRALILDSLDDNNNVIKTKYAINTVNSMDNLQVYSWSGASWGSIISPYLVGDSTSYQLTSTLQNAGTNEFFLYCGYQNNCTQFPTAGASGTLVPPGNAAFAASGSTALATPDLATKVIAYGWTFTRPNVYPAVTRTISDNFIRMGPPLVSYAADDVQYFDQSNGSFPNLVYFTYGMVYDYAQRRFLIAGTNNTGTFYIYSTTRTGEKLSYGSNSNNQSPVSFNNLGSFWPNGLALKSDGTTLLMLYGFSNSALKLATVDLGTQNTTGPVNLAAQGFIKPSGYWMSYGIAYDPSTPTDFYMCGQDNTTSKIKIYERNVDGTPSTASPNSWVLPTNVDNGTQCALTLDPTTGDFYLAQNLSDKDVTIWHITRASSTTDDHFEVLLSGSANSSTSSTIPSTTSGSGNTFQISYDPTSNHIFMYDDDMSRVFEIIPPRLISPRS